MRWLVGRVLDLAVADLVQVDIERHRIVARSAIDHVPKAVVADDGVVAVPAMAVSSPSGAGPELPTSCRPGQYRYRRRSSERTNAVARKDTTAFVNLTPAPNDCEAHSVAWREANA